MKKEKDSQEFKEFIKIIKDEESFKRVKNFIKYYEKKMYYKTNSINNDKKITLKGCTT